MITKDASVNIWALKPQMRDVLIEGENLWNSFGHDFVITSGRDGIHSTGSLHYYGYAVDVRTWEEDGTQWTDTKRANIAENLRKRLDKYSDFYDVVVHKTHIHVEYDAFRAGIINTV